MSAARSWKAYNIAKERRFMERTAELELVPQVCYDCGGKGFDVGSLSSYEPEPCPVCHGAGEIFPAERIERKAMGWATE